MMDVAMESYNHDKIKIQNLERLLENTRSDCEYLKSRFGDINDQIAKYLEEQRRYYEQLKQLKDDLDLQTIERG